MAHKIHGQHVNRQERDERYQKWSGASIVGEDGQVKKASTDTDPVIVEQEVRQLRSLISSGVRNICLDISSRATVEAIKEVLTEDERKCVTFGSEEEHVTL